MPTAPCSRGHLGRNLNLARVLVVDDDPATRLTLETILRAGGYSVDSATTPTEAVDLLDQEVYELVLSDPYIGSTEETSDVVAHARSREYQPAVAYYTAEQDFPIAVDDERPEFVIAPEDVPELLGQVADLIGIRALRRNQYIAPDTN